MKKQIRKTGEIIDVISFSCDTTPDESDTVKCVDSSGERKTLKLNYYWDLEDVGSDVDYWDDLRNKAAIKIYAARMSMYLGKTTDVGIIMDASIKDADDLIKKLKSKK